MKREILFRGKHLETGIWLYGAYCDESCENTDFPCIIPKLGAAEVDEWEVIPETVGQYTGMTDKNGKRIFEGDILEAHYDEKFPENVSRTAVVWGGWENHAAWSLQNEWDELDALDDFAVEYNEVVGNIYDNPDLIGGKNERNSF